MTWKTAKCHLFVAGQNHKIQAIFGGMQEHKTKTATVNTSAKMVKLPLQGH